MSSAFQAGSEPIPGYRLIRPKAAPDGVHRWEAIDPNQRRVVVRLIAMGRPLTQDEKLGFATLRQIDHPNLLPLLGAVEAPGLLGLVYAAFEMTFSERLADCRAAGFSGLPVDEWLHTLQGAALGLDELNQPRAVPPVFGGDPPRHRDLQPANIVLEGGTARLVDGGVPAVLGALDSEIPPVLSPWRAPEQIYLGASTERSDLYSLAASFVYLRHGRPPFPSCQNLQEQLTRTPDLEGLAVGERMVIERALAKDPLKRFRSAGELATAWTTALNGAVRPAGNGQAMPLAQARVIEPTSPAASPVYPLSFDSPIYPGGGAAVAVAPPVPKTAAPVKSAKSSAPSATKGVPVAQPASAAAKLETQTEENPQEELLPPESVKGWAWSVAMHAILLLCLAIWVIPNEIGKRIKQIDTRLAGSEAGSELSNQLTGGIGIDTPLAMPDVASPVESGPTFTSVPLSQLNLEAPKLNAPPSGQRATAKGSGPNLGGGPQAGNGDGFGVAKFGQGGENINGVDVKVGDPQFTLIWDSRADLDLHVLEPPLPGREPAHIYWESRNGNQGGELDVDDVDGFGPENVYWVQGQGPPGEYRWYVHYYGGLGGQSTPTRWKVRLKHNGAVSIFQGKLNQIGQRSQIYSFKIDLKDPKAASAEMKESEKEKK
jgi:hypothetical protein